MNTMSLASLAASMNLSPVAAVALPTTVEVAARKVGMSAAEMLFQAHQNARLRDYLAQVCRQVTA